MSQNPLLVFDENGIYCPIADVYLDPWRPVKKAIITHGHADHARWGHENYLTHHSNMPIIKHRLGDVHVEGKSWNEPFTINGVKFTLFPAGHIIGSSQVRVAYKGQVWVFTGDFKTEDDGFAMAYEPVRCDALITECTFGLPIFKWQPQQDTMNDIAEWYQGNKNQGRTSVIFAYALGKSQRLIKYLHERTGPIYTHGAIANLNDVISRHFDLPQTRRITRETTKEELRGKLVIAPPSAHGSTWIRKMSPYVTASVSGWMSIRGARRRRAVDKGFVLSDHADWNGLNQAIEATGAHKIICTHGYTELFTQYLNEQGYVAFAETTDYLGEQDTEDPETETAA